MARQPPLVHGCWGRLLLGRDIFIRGLPWRAMDTMAAIPVDLVTTSASGLDPDISPDAAEFQIPRVAKERGMSPADLRALVARHTLGRQFGILGEPRVNVLELNMELDATSPLKK